MRLWLTLLLLVSSPLAFADQGQVDCLNDLDGSQLILHFEAGKLFSVTPISANGSAGFEELATQLPNQGGASQVVYQLTNNSNLLTIDQSILKSGSGEAQLGFDNFNCSAE